MRTKRKTTPAASALVASRNSFDDAATHPCGDARRHLRLDVNIEFHNPLTGFPQIPPTVRTTETHGRTGTWCRPHRDKVVCLSSSETGFGSTCRPEHELRRCDSCRAA